MFNMLKKMLTLFAVSFVYLLAASSSNLAIAKSELRSLDDVFSTVLPFYNNSSGARFFGDEGLIFNIEKEEAMLINQKFRLMVDARNLYENRDFNNISFFYQGVNDLYNPINGYEEKRFRNSNLIILQARYKKDKRYYYFILFEDNFGRSKVQNKNSLRIYHIFGVKKRLKNLPSLKNIRQLASMKVPVLLDELISELVNSESTLHFTSFSSENGKVKEKLDYVNEKIKKIVYKDSLISEKSNGSQANDSLNKALNLTSNKEALEKTISSQVCEYVSDYKRLAFGNSGIANYSRQTTGCRIDWATGGYTKMSIKSSKIFSCKKLECNFTTEVICNFNGYLGAKGCEGMTDGVIVRGTVKLNVNGKVIDVDSGFDNPLR